jgi:hypothetical protein
MKLSILVNLSEILCSPPVHDRENIMKFVFGAQERVWVKFGAKRFGIFSSYATEAGLVVKQ